MNEIPQVWGGSNYDEVTIEFGDTHIVFPLSEARDLGRCLIALADEAGE